MSFFFFLSALDIAMSTYRWGKILPLSTRLFTVSMMFILLLSWQIWCKINWLLLLFQSQRTVQKAEKVDEKKLALLKKYEKEIYELKKKVLNT